MGSGLRNLMIDSMERQDNSRLSFSALSDGELLKSCGRDSDALPFTGERVIPFAVEPQLWHEHVSRYRFACLFAGGRRVLDIGCGTGYGTELLAAAAQSALGLDISGEAINYARQRFRRARFLCGSAEALPLPTASFDVVTAFEVIEHLANWQDMLREAARVTNPEGVFLVSTPNAEYYGESRGDAGPNPFHIHEFEPFEFQEELSRFFPFVQMLAQNQQENITFSGVRPPDACAAFVPPTDDLSHCHFLIAVCSFRPIHVPFFADVSSTHNLLREREHHIRGLQGELLDAQRHADQLVQLNRSLADVNRALTNEVEGARSCAWVRLGRRLGVGPWSDTSLSVRAVFGQFARILKPGNKSGHRTST